MINQHGYRAGVTRSKTKEKSDYGSPKIIYHGSKNYIRSFQIYVFRLRNEVCLLIIEFRVSRNGVNEKTIKSRMNAKERKAKTKTKKSVRGGLAMPL